MHFLPLGDLVLQVQHRLVINIFPLDSGLYLAIRRLKKSTIPAKDFMFRITSEPLEDLGTIDDRKIMLSDIANHERAGHVDGSNVDLRISSSSNSHL